MEENRKEISIASCFATIIFSAIALCTLMIPLDGAPIYEIMPLVGDGTIEYFNQLMIANFADLVSLSSQLYEYLSIALKYGMYAYMIIPAANIVFALVLMITRFEFFRSLFKFISVFCGIAFMLLMLIQLAIVIGIFSRIIPEIAHLSGDDFKLLIIPVIFLSVSSIMSRKQFKWFRHK